MDQFPEKSEPIGKILVDTFHAFRDNEIINDAERTASWTPDTNELEGIATRNRWASAAIWTAILAELIAILGKHEITWEQIPDIMLIISFSVLWMMWYRLRLYSKRIQEIVEQRRVW